MLRTSARIIAVIVMTASWAVAAAPSIEWTRTFAGCGTAEGYCVLQTGDGGFAAVGETFPDSAYPSFYLVKTDSLGDSQWERVFSGAGSIMARSVLQTMDGGYVIAGWGQLPQNAYRGVCLLKTNELGVLEWQKQIEGSVLASGYSVVQSADGGFAVAALYDMSDSALLLIKTDSLGNRQWGKRYPVAYPTYGDQDRVQLRLATDGGYIVGTKTLLKVDSVGTQEWLRSCVGVTGAYSVVLTSDGGYAASGPADDSRSEDKRQIFLLKTSSQGSVQWFRKYVESKFSRAYWVEQTADYGYIVAGTIQTSEDLGCIVRTDPSGVMVWSDTLQNTASASCIRQAADGGFIITGAYFDAAANNDLMYITKLAPEP